MKDAPLALRAVNVTKRFHGRSIVDRVNLTLAAGQCVALVGANGSGKTTLLRCLAASIRTTTGEVWWCGRRAAESPSTRRCVGMLAHESGLYSHLTLRENFVFAARMVGLRDPRAIAEQTLKQVDLLTAAERLPRHLSRGMRQRASLARVTIHDPPILLLDEPFAHLDTTSANWLAGMLVERKQRGAAICYSTHDTLRLHEVADRVWRLEEGRVHEVDLVGRAAAGRTLPNIAAA
ncbi:MAG: heme ABC exporter ATP-binding protein CcmA [Pirellulales bacterium]